MPDETFSKRSVTEILDVAFEEALKKGASDIHFVPMGESVRIRLRIDGLLEDWVSLPASLHSSLVARLKVLAKLRSDVHSLPHDGRFFYYPCDGPRVDMRLSIVPTYHGESAVLRLLISHFAPQSLVDLDFSPYDESLILKALRRQQGMIVIAGPTGSGKTTTLYTLIRLLDKPDVSIITIEDPVEYALEGIAQIQIQHERGLTFASALRSVLRQDPDIIMIGEIRDTETARIAIQAALTGHLIICTLHASEASAVVPRLFDMGIDPYLVAATLKLVIGQRLVRRKVGGRMGVNEVLNIDETIRTAILEKKSGEAIKAMAVTGGMVTLHQDGLQKSARGLTTLNEILRVLSE
ncbi:MAG: GspE/PulE family protein [Candidatus Pacebacteria bacterium]|nr:GspE/PulE family protein [Candidatus Paceibacterota bacterium]